jgi:nitrogen PTS system EIIA component
MNISSRTPEGLPGRCSICGQDVVVDPSVPPGDATCLQFGSLLWIASGSETVGRVRAKAIIEAVGDYIPNMVAVADVDAPRKADAIRLLVKKLVAISQIRRNDEDDVITAILRREELGSTGIGRGFAIPHAKHAAVDRIVGAIGLSEKGIEFESLDHEPVHTIVLLVSPPNRPGDHLRVLERISNALRQRKLI